jgi:uncharacterized protein YbjT (DUF2867 family)
LIKVEVLILAQTACNHTMPMSNILVVVGASGTQGGSVIHELLKKGTHSLRGVTRDASSAKSSYLVSRGVEMVEANLDDEQSLIRAFNGASAIFAATDFYETFRRADPWTAMDVEYKRGVNLARAAASTTTLEHYIWSTLPSAFRTTSGESFVPHFEAKARVDEFIKSLPNLHERTTFFWLPFFMENFLRPTFSPAYHGLTDRYLFLLPTPRTTRFGLIHSGSIGIFVRAALEQREQTLPGKYVLARSESATLSEVVDRWTKVVGKKAQFVEVSPESYSSMYPGNGQEMYVMLQFWSEFGDSAWSGEEVMSGNELGIQEELMGLEEAFKTMQWEF